ncbi:MAG: DUF2797 domain-containing protein [Bacteriovoracaceae bacterium]
MLATGTLSKMKTTQSSPVKYELTLGEVHYDITSLVGKTIRLTYSGNIFCENCGKKTKKSYAQGFCYPCTMKLAECDLCILKPETCHYDKGTCREPEWGLENCFRPHVIYLANSSGLKVGITRKTQVPTRWIDQGATEALPILEVKNRFVSGQIEVIFKKMVADKTDWRKMLKGDPEKIDLVEWKNKLLAELGEHLKAHEYTVLDEPVVKFSYPVNKYPEKVSSFNLDKTSEIKAKLSGIKGQYLIFETGVLNVRSHTGYEVTIEAHEAEQDGTQNNLS